MSLRILYLQGPTGLLNPSYDKRRIEAAYKSDAEVAAAEFGGNFRSDVSAYLPDDVIDRALCPGERSRPRATDVSYVGFVDASGGGGSDAMTCAVAHQGERGRCFVDALLAVDPPFDVEATCERAALLLKAYGVTYAQADRYAGQWPAQSFARHGIVLAACELTRSQLYAECAPLFVSNLVSLIDDARLITELRGLERRPARGGRPDAIDHAPGRGSHDDRINAVAGALWLANRIAPGIVAGVGGSVTHCLTDYDVLERDNERAQSGNRQPYEPAPRPWMIQPPR